MKLEDEPEKFVSFSGQGIVVQMRNRFGFDGDPSAVGLIKQAKNIKQRAFAAARRAHHRMDRPPLELERNPSQSVHARIVFAQEAFDALATERNLGVHEFLR